MGWLVYAYVCKRVQHAADETTSRTGGSGIYVHVRRISIMPKEAGRLPDLHIRYCWRSNDRIFRLFHQRQTESTLTGIYVSRCQIAWKPRIKKRAFGELYKAMTSSSLFFPLRIPKLMINKICGGLRKKTFLWCDRNWWYFKKIYI